MLGELDFSLLTENLTPPNQHSLNGNVDDNDPFSLALKQLDEHNSKLQADLGETSTPFSSYTTEYELNDNNKLNYTPQQPQQRKIIKINSSSLIQTNPKQNSTSLTSTQPIVRVLPVSILVFFLFCILCYSKRILLKDQNFFKSNVIQSLYKYY